MGSPSPQKLPLAQFKIFHTQQLDEAREVVAQAYADHKLDYALPNQHVDCEMSEVRLPHSSIIVLSYDAWVNVTVEEPEGVFACQFQLSGNNTFKIGKEEIDTGEHIGAMISPTKSVLITENPNSRILGFRVDPETLHAHLESLLMFPLSRPLEFDARMDLRGVQGWLSRYIRFFVDELDQLHSGLLQAPAVLANFEQSMITSLLLGQPHNYTTYLSNPRNAAAPRQVKMVEDYLEAHVAQPIDMTSLAKMTGYSLRSIYKGFRQFRGYSPMTYLKKTRLAHLRKRLLEGPPNRHLTQHALDLGFVHLGRLSGDYKRQFGESPSETLRRAGHRQNKSSLKKLF